MAPNNLACNCRSSYNVILLRVLLLSLNQAVFLASFLVLYLDLGLGLGKLGSWVRARSHSRRNAKQLQSIHLREGEHSCDVLAVTLFEKQLQSSSFGTLAGETLRITGALESNSVL